MSKPATPKARVRLDILPPLLRTRIQEAIQAVEGDPSGDPKGTRRARKALRKKLEADHSDGGIGCILPVVAFFLLQWYGVRGYMLFLAAACVAVACIAAGKYLQRRRMFGKGADHGLSTDVLEAAGKVAGFGEIERAALAVALAPNAGPDVRAEVDRLLAEDERLRTICQGLRPVDQEPIEADRLRLKKALEEEKDPVARRTLEESLALCEQRAKAASDLDGVESRIEAQRELILQTLRAAGEALTHSALDPPELDSVHQRADALSKEVAALEAAVQEMRTL